MLNHFTCVNFFLPCFDENKILRSLLLSSTFMKSTAIRKWGYAVWNNAYLQTRFIRLAAPFIFFIDVSIAKHLLALKLSICRSSVAHLSFFYFDCDRINQETYLLIFSGKSVSDVAESSSNLNWRCCVAPCIINPRRNLSAMLDTLIIFCIDDPEQQTPSLWRFK